ncbi:MAG TPA: GNAT family N-acetyltransferase [Solirubrobacteraceae bacterium]|nr:GNAT family N-acetyltransferase [Solirubrobacteraceae bacterium]
MATTVRHADPGRDAAACAAIYAPYVHDSAVSFEDVPPSAAGFAETIERTSRTHPFIVLEDDGRVVGYAYASQHRPRAAYRWAADVAIYVDAGYQRRGAGRRLYEALFELMRRQGLRIACAGITVPNDASIGLHRAVGFQLVGTYERIGWKAGAWRDVSWWQKQLAPGEDGAPVDPGPPARLPSS